MDSTAKSRGSKGEEVSRPSQAQLVKIVSGMAEQRTCRLGVTVNVNGDGWSLWNGSKRGGVVGARARLRSCNGDESPRVGARQAALRRGGRRRG